MIFFNFEIISIFSFCFHFGLMNVFVFATAVSSCGAPVWLPRLQASNTFQHHLYKIENQAVQASNTFQHHLYKIENQAALENTNIPQLSKKTSTKSCPSKMMFFLFFFVVLFCFLFFSFRPPTSIL